MNEKHFSGYKTVLVLLIISLSFILVGSGLGIYFYVVEKLESLGLTLVIISIGLICG